MFTPATQATMIAAFKQTLNLLSQVNATWTQAKPPNQTANMTLAFRQIGKDDEYIINAYGTGTIAMVAEKADFPVNPEKLDTITVPASGERYTVQAVHPRMLGNSVIFLDIYAKGQ